MKAIKTTYIRILTNPTISKYVTNCVKNSDKQKDLKVTREKTYFIYREGKNMCDH